MLSLPNVKVNVEVHNLPCVLDSKGCDAGRAQFRETTDEDRHYARSMKRRLQQRDWRLLREDLLNINFSEEDERLVEPARVLVWLKAAGYVPESDLRRILPSDFAAEQLTPQIIRSLKSLRDAVRIAMVLSESDFQWAIRKALAYDEDLTETYKASIEDALRVAKPRSLRLGRQSSSGHPVDEYEKLAKQLAGKPYPGRYRGSHPARDFLKKLAARATEKREEIAELIQYALDDKREIEVAGQLEQILRGGIGVSGLRAASFGWDQKGVAVVTVHIATPIDAIRLSVAIDRNFSKCRMVCCPCGEWFDQKRGRDRFHSDKCRNKFTTRDRRAKVKLLQEGQQAWLALAAAKRRGRDRWEWITAWAMRKGRENDPAFTIDPEWANSLKELRKAGN
jgi:hypothetical protein